MAVVSKEEAAAEAPEASQTSEPARTTSSTASQEETLVNAPTNPWNRPAQGVFPEPNSDEEGKTEEVEEGCDGEDWLMVDENAKETMTEGPLDYAPAPISEFIVKSRTKMKADRWEIL